MQDRRSVTRIRVVKKATIVSDDGLTRLEVDLVDLSRRGARIVLRAGQVLPSDFYVLMPDKSMHACNLVWRGPLVVGIRFQA